jgi:acylphosphatase
VCRQFKIHGRVQGVFFRASTRAAALPLGLRGYARNLPDGSVEVLACGDPEATEALLVWLDDGPPMAAVSAVTESPVDCSMPAGFAAD